MSDSTTIARPYAKAIFEYALAEKTIERSGLQHLLSLGASGIDTRGYAIH